jgi:hypothetical protein
MLKRQARVTALLSYAAHRRWLLRTEQRLFALCATHLEHEYLPSNALQAQQSHRTSLGHPVDTHLRLHVQVGDDLEGVALVYQELLPLCAVVHLLGIAAHERVEERAELFFLQQSTAQQSVACRSCQQTTFAKFCCCRICMRAYRVLLQPGGLVRLNSHCLSSCCCCCCAHLSTARLALLGPENASQALRLLSSAACMAADLDQDIGLRNVQAVVTNLRGTTRDDRQFGRQPATNARPLAEAHIIP